MKKWFTLEEATSYIEFQTGKAVADIRHQGITERNFKVRFIGEQSYQNYTL